MPNILEIILKYKEEMEKNENIQSMDLKSTLIIPRNLKQLNLKFAEYLDNDSVVVSKLR